MEDSLGQQFKSHASRSKAILPKPLEFLSTGSTLLNLALSDRHDGGWALGHMVHLIGDSDTGKSLAAMTAMAEASHDPRFDNYDLHYRDQEGAFDWDVDAMFGPKTAERVELVEDPSNLIEDWRDELLAILKKGTPFVSVMDSFDSLTSSDELKAVAKEAAGKGSGGYGADRAKTNSQILRMVTKGIEHNNSLLMIISQTRDVISDVSFGRNFGPKVTFSGGRALKFYGHQRVWLAVIERIKSKGKVIGSVVKAKVERTRITGKQRTVEFPVYYDYGIDDIGGMVDWLTIHNEGTEKNPEWIGIWKKVGQNIKADEFSFDGTRARLIQCIEEEGRVGTLRQTCGEYWNEIEESIRLNRRPRYTE